MYQKCWERLTDELNHYVKKGAKWVDTRLLLAYMDSIVDLERERAKNWKLEQQLKGYKDEP